MADRRGVRSSSRRMTPTPQPQQLAKAPSPQAGRAARKRGTRSASKDIETPTEAAKPVRRSARQASVASESEQEGLPGAKTKRKAQREVVRDLEPVEEVPTQIEITDAPNTPPRPLPDVAVPHRSPGGLSEMSGTTAISSFSMVEAELLEPRFIVRHLPRLYDVVEDFLDLLVPENGNDSENIKQMQMPDSEFNIDYRDFDEQAAIQLKYFRGEHQRYIHLRSIHRALFGANKTSAAAHCGLDLVLYLANVLILAKKMIHSNRNDKEVWDALRELDNFYPIEFLPALVSESVPFETTSGESTLLNETFELGLNLRTQLAILWLEKHSNGTQYDPDATLEEVFFQSESTKSKIREWNVSALGGGDSVLSQQLQDQVVERVRKMRRYFTSDAEALERGDMVDLVGLGEEFSWEGVIIGLLGWVRLRKRELQGAIQTLGGISAIVGRVKVEMQKSDAPDVTTRTIPRNSPRKKRTSFGRGRRRSSGKFNPNAGVDERVLEKLIARERALNIQKEADPVQPMHQNGGQELAAPTREGKERVAEEAAQRDEEMSQSAEAAKELMEEEVVEPSTEDEWYTLAEVDRRQPSQSGEEVIEEVAGPSRPPRSTAETLKLVKEGKKLDKENRGLSVFDRQPNAQRIEFGDGFADSQPSSSLPMTTNERQRPSSRKRQRVAEDQSDDEAAYEHEQRMSKVHERREKAKRVRIDPTSSGAPTSHQPPTRKDDADQDYQPDEQEESPSERDAPEMTEDPPPSTFANQKQLAGVNSRGVSVAHSLARPGRARKARTAWTEQEEEALVEYMRRFPQRYALILKYDESAAGHQLLQSRTQVNLKDKARTMALTMIKSGAGLLPGFESVITPDSALGRKLIDDGFEW